MASRIDYCNSILYRVAAVHLRPLQSVLNAAARLVLKLRKLIVSRSQRRLAMSYTGYQFTNESSTNCASLCTNVNMSRPQYTCRHFVRRSQLSQPAISCGRQPKTTLITREQELSHTAHGLLQFLDLHLGTYFRLL